MKQPVFLQIHKQHNLQRIGKPSEGNPVYITNYSFSFEVFNFFRHDLCWMASGIIKIERYIANTTSEHISYKVL